MIPSMLHCLSENLGTNCALHAECGYVSNGSVWKETFSASSLMAHKSVIEPDSRAEIGLIATAKYKDLEL